MDTQAPDIEIYNQEALRILNLLLFAPQSPVAYNIRRRWLRYSPSPGSTLRDAIIIIFRAILEEPVELELGDDYVQVFASPHLRIPADLVTTPAYRTLERGLRASCARHTLERPSMYHHYSNYKFNAILEETVSRASVVRQLATHILGFAHDTNYFQMRIELHSVVQELYYHFYTQHSHGTALRDAAMSAVYDLKLITAPYSELVRGIPPGECERERLTRSESSVFSISHDESDLDSAFHDPMSS